MATKREIKLDFSFEVNAKSQMLQYLKQKHQTAKSAVGFIWVAQIIYSHLHKSYIIAHESATASLTR